MCKKITAMFMMILSFFMGTINEAHAVNDGDEPITTITVSDSRYSDPAPVGYFEVEGVDGKNHIAFCGWHEKKSPQKGWKMSTVDVYTAENKKNENLRKVLWYGYDGPEDIGATYPETALAVSVALGHMDTDDTGETEGPVGKTFLNKVKKLDAPPSEYEVYCVRNMEETEYKYQCLVYALYEPMGDLSLQKKSADETTVQGNESYSLEGAIYGVFSDEMCQKLVTELVTNHVGTTDVVELTPGTYYVREVKSSPGYLVDETVYKVEILAGVSEKLEVEEVPAVIEVKELLMKYDKEIGFQMNGNQAQGGASLKDAEYQFDLYGGYYQTLEELKDKQPIKSWTMKTDEEGKILFEEFVQLPLGTLAVKEIAASEGYLLNKEIQLVHLQMQNEQAFEVLKSAETIIKGNVKIFKYEMNEKEERVPMEGVSFVFTSKTNGKEHVVVTDENGEASTKAIGGLPYDTYAVREENTPEGYIGCESFEVCISENEQMLTFEIENEKEIVPPEPEEEPEIEVPKDQENNKPVRTGDSNKGLLFVLSAGIAGLVLLMGMKRKKTP